MASGRHHAYDIIIVDETQDFSANQLRAVLAQLAPDGAASFIIDTAQRIYAGGFTWTEIGLTIRPENSHRLGVNYRNTPETARLAATLMSMVPLDDDGAPPAQGGLFINPKPVVLRGYYHEQAEWCINFIRDNVDLKVESVAFLHPKGWFAFLEEKLSEANIEYVSLIRKSAWPKGAANVALSTLHSAKGLDFDYVFIIGIDKQSFPEGDFDVGDDRFEYACRLLAMAIARARVRAVLGYKEGQRPNILTKLDAADFDEVLL
jgi:superfamily I DNA/RNA helicase